jgi:hypothetical protein
MPRLGSLPGLAGTTVSSTAASRLTGAGTTVSGTTVSGTAMSGTIVAGTIVSGTIVSGTIVARTIVARTIVCRTTVARTTVAGDTVAGTRVTRPMMRMASRFVSRPGRLRPPILARARPGYRHGRNGRLARPPRRGRLSGADGWRTRDGGQAGGGYLLRLMPGWASMTAGDPMTARAMLTPVRLARGAGDRSVVDESDHTLVIQRFTIFVRVDGEIRQGIAADRVQDAVRILRDDLDVVMK